MEVLAHGIGGRADLPVPLWLAVYGAASVVVLSFLALGVLWPTARLTGAEAGRPIPRRLAGALDGRVLRRTLRAITLVVSAVVVVAAVVGDERSRFNPAPWWLFITFWVGLVPVSLLFGPVWRVVNPLRTVHSGLSRLAGVDPARGSRDLPASWGCWPAVAWLAAFAWLELAYPYRDNPRVVGFALVGYAVVNLLAASRFGDAWFGRGDGFEAYSSLIGRLAPIGRRADGELVRRNPLNGLASSAPLAGSVGLVIVLLGSTAFDGVTRSTWWQSLTDGRSRWGEAGLATFGLAVVVAVAAAAYVVATRIAGRPAKHDPQPLPGAFAHSLIPIVVGYAIAHYFSLLLLDGQQSVILASDPFHTGADWFGTRGWQVNYAVVSTRTIALVQVGAIVAGHVVGVVSAHDQAVRLFPGRAAVRGQYPLLAVMVAFTVGGILLLLGV